MVEVIMLDARGGAVVKEAIRERADGTVEREQQLTPPNGKLALEYLARTRPRDWRPVKAVEVSGPEGRPVAVLNDNLAALAARVSKVRAQYEAGEP
ncbi:hypothetical protein [Bailinhaonella thermotolerans]|uniref:hypothetical protein n=1 Tax=Bailinhaonella thermotolerans TaxID=1070861 RepID=UPI0011C3A903|nr:hypothetical protein [Bailinhaonella thermotolerans]